MDNIEKVNAVLREAANRLVLSENERFEGVLGTDDWDESLDEGMFKFTNEKAAKKAAKEKGLYYGFAVFGGEFYVGTEKQLKKIGIVKPKKESLNEAKKHSFKVGDKVVVTSEGLRWHAKSIPASAGYTSDQMAWRKRLSKLADAKTVGTISKVFPNSNNLNVEFPGEKMTIGLYAEMVKKTKSESLDEKEDPAHQKVSVAMAKISAKGTGNWTKKDYAKMVELGTKLIAIEKKLGISVPPGLVKNIAKWKKEESLDEAKVVGLFKIQFPSGKKELTKKGTMKQLNQWAKKQGFDFKKEPGSLFGGYWVNLKTREAYKFDVVSESLDEAKPKVVVYDNGGKTVDRYTVIIGTSVYGMSDNPNHPQGLNQYAGEVGQDVKVGSHLGKKLSKVPKEIEKAVKQRMAQESANAQKPEAVQYMESLGWNDKEISRMLFSSGYSAEQVATMMGKTIQPASEPVLEESQEAVPFGEMLEEELTLIESVSEAENRLRDMFQSKKYKGTIPDADIQTMLKSKSWHKIAGGEKNLQKAWKNLIDDDFIEKKGNKWVWTLGYLGAAKEEEECGGADHLRLLGWSENQISEFLTGAGADESESATFLQESSSFKDVATKHQIKIAVKTLKMHKAGALIMGGMNHKEAVKVLRKAGWSDKKIQDALKKSGHSSSDIAAFMKEDVATVPQKGVELTSADGFGELEDMGIGGSQIASLLEGIGHHKEAIDQLTETLDLTEGLLLNKSRKWNQTIHGKNCRTRWEEGGHVVEKMWIEELPGKPVKRKVRYTLINMPPWMPGTQSRFVSPFMLSNLVRDAKLSKSMDYDKTVAAMKKAIKNALDKVLSDPDGKRWIGKMKPNNVVDSFFDGDTVSYLQVEPDDYSDMVVDAKDFTVSTDWNGFKAYDPGADFQSHDPTYTQYASKSPTSARKFYKIMKADPDALKKVSWDGFGKWLQKNKIPYDINFSQYR